MISLKSKEEIILMAKGGKILAEIMEELKRMTKPGVTTQELNTLAESLILKAGAKCSFKGYQNFPSCLCVSLNEEITHNVPSARQLKEGDIITLDLGLFYSETNFSNGFHLDMAVTLPVGEVSPEIRRLLRVGKKVLKLAIKKVRPGNTLGDIGNTIQRYVESQGFNVIQELCGHGIGKKIHERPDILNFGQRHQGEKLKEGMVFTLEPMISLGNWRIKKSSDGYGFETKDGSLSCLFEHTVAVIENGCQVLTQ